MLLKFLFDRVVSFIGLLLLWPLLIVVAILIKIKMPGGPAFFTQKRVGKNGKLFTCHKFRSMTMKHGGSTVSVAGDSRITPLGATLRHYKKEGDIRTAQEIAEEFNDRVIYPDKVRINKYYYEHYSFIKDIQMIFCTVLGKNMKYNNEII